MSRHDILIVSQLRSRIEGLVSLTAATCVHAHLAYHAVAQDNEDQAQLALSNLYRKLRQVRIEIDQVADKVGALVNEPAPGVDER